MSEQQMLREIYETIQRMEKDLIHRLDQLEENVSQRLNQMEENLSRLLEQENTRSVRVKEKSEEIRADWKSHQDPKAIECWKQVLKEVQKRISQPSYQTWLVDTGGVDFGEGTLFVRCPNEFARDWLTSRYQELVEEIYKEINGHSVSIRFVTENDK